MKKKYFYVVAFAALSVFCFSSCGEENERFTEIEVTKEVQRISFERVALNADGYQNIFPDGLILSDVDFYNHSDAFSWSGFAVSENTDKTTAGYDNEFSVFADGGVNNSQKFAIAYDGYYDGASYAKTECKLPQGQQVKFKGLWINSATITALSIKNGDAFAKKFEAGDWFKIIIVGFDGNGNKTAEKEFYLADFRDGKTFICNEWTFVDLSALGKVNKLEFAFDSTDKGTFGVNTPKYACIDDIIYYVD
ncbi:MAG: DUF4465 domain-containing protein [Prevotellaceae bacterium]|nr:DUF4465 domain-containing protein [Prevotellaceae bacterium]